MAVVSCLIGGVFGFVAFLSMLIFGDATFAQAAKIYLTAGLGAVALLMTTCMLVRSAGALNWRDTVSVDADHNPHEVRAGT